MSRRQRREHKKQLTRRRNGGKRAAMALAGAAAIAAGTQAYANPIRYDNPPGPGHFDWVPTGPAGIDLDVLLPASSQPHVSPVSFTQNVDSTTGKVTGSSSAPAQLQVGGYYDIFLVGVDGSELIPSGAPWYLDGFTYYTGYGAELPEGQQTYLGVRFDLGSGLQYGWIGVVRTGLELDAFAWGYETEVGVPIPAGIPEPGTLAVLALGAAGLAGRRAKRQPRA